MSLIMKDQVTPEQRLNKLIDYTGRECMGCGQMSDDIAIECDFTDDDFEGYSVETDWGHWYCHQDCYRDSWIDR